MHLSINLPSKTTFSLLSATKIPEVPYDLDLLQIEDKEIRRSSCLVVGSRALIVFRFKRVKLIKRNGRMRKIQLLIQNGDGRANKSSHLQLKL